MTGDAHEDGPPPLAIELDEALGAIMDSTAERRQFRLLDAMGEELARVTGVLVGPDWVEEEGERFAELRVCDRGLSARVKIALDTATACTISPDGTLTGTLPSGAAWVTTPLGVAGGA